MSIKICSSFPRTNTLHSLKAYRTFITLPGTEPQSLSTTRILPYNSTSLYKIIADVDSYSTFIPYCVSSKVTSWSSADSKNRRWPSEADLKVGWGGYEETFTSRLYCVPGSIVEALGGEALTTIPHSQLAHHKDRQRSEAKAKANNIFQSIRAKWMVRPLNSPTQPIHKDKTELVPREQTEVHLSLEFQFSNPIYAALSNAITPKIAGIMIEAFETRAKKLLDGTNYEDAVVKTRAEAS